MSVAEQEEIKAPAEPESPAPASKRFRLSSVVKWVVIPLLLIALSVAGRLYWSYASVRESTDDAQIDGHIYPISAMVDGTILAVLVDNNQYVEAGTVLARIDSKFYDAALEKAKGDLGEAIANRKETRAGVPITSIDTSTQLSGAEAGVTEQTAKIATAQREVDAANARLATAQAHLREVQANASKAASDLERMKPLVDKEEISRQQYDAVVATAAAATATADSARSQIQEAQEGVRVAETKLDQERAHMAEVRSRVAAARTGPQQLVATEARAESSGAQVVQKEATLRQAQIYLDYTTVRAPVSGRVSQRSMEVGQAVTRGQGLIAIVPVEDVWVTANFKESQLEHIHPGQSVTIAVDAYGGRKYQGHVDSIGAATGARFSLLPPENATGNYVKVVQRLPVKILFDQGQDSEHLLRPGMSVSPTVLTK